MTVEDFLRRAIAFHAPMIDGAFGDQGDQVQGNPFPKDDVFRHNVGLHFAFHFDVKDLQCLLSYKQKKEKSLRFKVQEITEVWRACVLGLLPFKAMTLEAGFMMAESAEMGLRIGLVGSDMSMITTWFVSPTFSRTQMYLSDSMVRLPKPMLLALMPTFVS